MEISDEMVERALDEWLAHAAAFMFNQTLGAENSIASHEDRKERLCPWMRAALAAALSPEAPAAGSVRVRKIVQISISNQATSVLADDGTMWWMGSDHTWKPYSPLPQPAEIAGAVEEVR